jgi:EAL domain-containing protein (putative c-di-GMP-specific phosphodiesterase class I)
MKAVELLDFAFQPIVNSLSGVTFAVEALVRGNGSAGFPSIGDMFDAAYEEKALYAFDLALRRKAIKKFSRIGFHSRVKLFYNYDPRVHEMADYRFGMTEAILGELGLANDMLCFELSEQHRIGPEKLFKDVMTRTRQRGFKIALDDFGAGFSSFELFYHSDPDFLKFDRFLIKGIDSDIKKRTFFSHILSLAKALGVVAIAEGVETEREFLTCKELGCDLIQGYYIQRPTLAVDELLPAYAHVGNLEKRNLRKGEGNAVAISREIVRLDTVCIDEDMKMLFTASTAIPTALFSRALTRTDFPWALSTREASRDMRILLSVLT